MSARQFFSDLYVVAIDTPEVERLQIQYTPLEISYARKANVANIAIVGRNEDLHHYVSGSTSLSLSLDFFAIEADKEDAKRKIKWLESMLYSDGSRPPSRLKIVFGRLFKDEIWILTDMSVKYSVFEPGNGFLPRYAVADLNFVRDTDLDLSSSKIRNQVY